MRKQSRKTNKKFILFTRKPKLNQNHIYLKRDQTPKQGNPSHQNKNHYYTKEKSKK